MTMLKDARRCRYLGMKKLTIYLKKYEECREYIPAVPQIPPTFLLSLRPFQDYFNSYEAGQSVGGAKTENLKTKLLPHPQAELGLSHMCPFWGSSSHQTQG